MDDRMMTKAMQLETGRFMTMSTMIYNAAQMTIAAGTGNPGIEYGRGTFE